MSLKSGTMRGFANVGMTSIVATVTTVALAMNVSQAATISDFESPNVNDYSYYAPGDGWKADLDLVGKNDQNQDVPALPSFTGGHTGSDAIGTGQATSGQFLTDRDQYGYINSGGGQIGVVISDPFATTTAGNLYSLSVEFGRRLDGVGNASGGTYKLGFLVDFDPGASFENINTSNGSTEPVTAINPVSIARSTITQGTFVPVSTAYAALADGQSLRAVILFNNNGDNTGFSQAAFDDLAFSVTAVPEPTTFGLVAAGGLMVLRRRRASV